MLKTAVDVEKNNNLYPWGEWENDNIHIAIHGWDMFISYDETPYQWCACQTGGKNGQKNKIPTRPRNYERRPQKQANGL